MVNWADPDSRAKANLVQVARPTRGSPPDFWSEVEHRHYCWAARVAGALGPFPTLPGPALFSGGPAWEDSPLADMLRYALASAEDRLGSSAGGPWPHHAPEAHHLPPLPSGFVRAVVWLPPRAYFRVEWDPALSAFGFKYGGWGPRRRSDLGLSSGEAWGVIRSLLAQWDPDEPGPQDAHALWLRSAGWPWAHPDLKEGMSLRGLDLMRRLATVRKQDLSPRHVRHLLAAELGYPPHYVFGTSQPP